jgi:hypothetical protein
MPKKEKPSESSTPVEGEVDRRALKILNETCLARLDAGDEPLPTSPDVAYARSKGMLFDPARFTHDEKTSRVVQACTRVAAPGVARGFLASLGSGCPEFRGALGSYAVFRHMRDHKYQPKDSADVEHRRWWCVACGDKDDTIPYDDLNWVIFHRFRQGCAYDSPLEASFLLEQFASSHCPEPTANDRRILTAILDAAGSQGSSARAGELVKVVAKLVKGNKYGRQSLVESLGFCGVLQPKDCPSYLERFVEFEERVYPPGKVTEWAYPIRCWQGRDGVNTTAVKFWFPDLL